MMTAYALYVGMSSITGWRYLTLCRAHVRILCLDPLVHGQGGEGICKSQSLTTALMFCFADGITVPEPVPMELIHLCHPFTHSVVVGFFMCS